MIYLKETATRLFTKGLSGLVVLPGRISVGVILLDEVISLAPSGIPGDLKIQQNTL